MSKTLLTLTVAFLTTTSAWSGQPSTFNEVITPYEQIRQTLIADSMEGIQEHGEAIANALKKLESHFSSERSGATAEVAATVRELLPGMIEAAQALSETDSIEEAREAFYELSKPLVRWRAGISADDRPSVAYCSMHKRSWLQPGTEIGNPYGNMPRCGRIVSE